jgi:hypothetical protein
MYAPNEKALIVGIMWYLYAAVYRISRAFARKWPRRGFKPPSGAQSRLKPTENLSASLVFQSSSDDF